MKITVEQLLVQHLNEIWNQRDETHRLEAWVTPNLKAANTNGIF